MGYGGKPAHIASVMSAHFATGICRLKPAHIASAVPAHFATGIWGLKPAHIASEVPAHFATGIWGLKPAHIASEVSAHFAKGGSRRILQPANANPAHFANIPVPDTFMAFNYIRFSIYIETAPAANTRFRLC
jgi:hypothetical protein